MATTVVGPLTLAAVRPAAAAVLAAGAADDINVQEDYVDSVTPPALMLAWDDPMLVPGVARRPTMGPCEYTARLRVVCVAARLDPGAGGDELERLVAYVLGAMRADTYVWTLDSVSAPRQTDQSNVASLIAEVAYVVQTTIEENPMAAPVGEPLPLILTDASIKINDTELACVANHVELSPDTTVTTLDTMCGSKDYPGTVKWSLVATLYQSFDPDATEDVLSAAVAAYKLDGTLASFEVVPYKSRPVAADNPSWAGEVIPQDYSPINGDAGDASTIDLEWSCAAEPVKTVVPGALTARAASSSSKS